jgi:hypothetical protein
METKQTAVQWLYDELSQCMHREEVCDLVYKLEQKAKQMEREQIENAHRWGQEDEKEFWNLGDKVGTILTIKSEEYYNKTYGGQDE